MAPTRSIRLALIAALILFFATPARGETVIVQRRTRVLAHPTDDADMVLRVKKDRPAKVLKRKSSWIKVRVAGEVGWVPTSQIEEEREEEQPVDEDELQEEEQEPEDGEQVADADEPADDDEEVAGVGRAEEPAAKKTPAAPRFAAAASLGVRTVNSSFTSDGAMELGSYRLSARSYSAGFGFEAVAYRSGQLSGVLDARYQGSVGSPGVQFATGEAGTGYVPFTTHDIDAGGRLGWSFGWVRASGRVGYHTDILHVEKLDNVGKMPSEILRGYTVGAAIEAPFHGAGWSGRAAIDTLVGGKRKQTVGLEDGAPGAAKATWITLAVGYALTSALSAELGYRRATWSSRWSGTSAREADITSAARSDKAQQLTVGLSQAF